MDVVALIGRLIFVMIFFRSGINHLRLREAMVQYSRANGAPAPELLVPATGVMLLVGSLLIAVGVWPDLGALLLVLFLFPVAFYMHAFWKVDDPQMRAMQEAHFLKNISLGGASILIFALFVEFGDALELIPVGPLFK